MQRSRAGTNSRKGAGRVGVRQHSRNVGVGGKSGKKPVGDNHPFVSREKLAMRGAGSVCRCRPLTAEMLSASLAAWQRGVCSPTCMVQRPGARCSLAVSPQGHRVYGCSPYHRHQFRGVSGLRPGGRFRCRLPAKSLHHAPASLCRRAAPAHTPRRRHPA